MAETVDNIKIDETGSLKPSRYVYLCPERKMSWLFGRNVDDRPITDYEWRMLKRLLELGMEPETAFDEWADQIFRNDLWNTESGLKRIIGRDLWSKAPQEARMITLNMAYNMGLSRFGEDKWPNFYRCFREGDWPGCAIQMQWTDDKKAHHSLWYQQTKSRAVRLVQAMAALGGAS